jgi:hypothetical protein
MTLRKLLKKLKRKKNKTKRYNSSLIVTREALVQNSWSLLVRVLKLIIKLRIHMVLMQLSHLVKRLRRMLLKKSRKRLKLKLKKMPRKKFLRKLQSKKFQKKLLKKPLSKLLLSSLLKKPQNLLRNNLLKKPQNLLRSNLLKKLQSLSPINLPKHPLNYLLRLPLRTNQKQSSHHRHQSLRPPAQWPRPQPGKTYRLLSPAKRS